MADTALKSLPKRHQTFVLKYICEFKGKQSAIDAGFSKRTAAQQASRLLTKVNVQKAIAEQVEARMERTKIDADWVLRRLVNEADADLADLYDDDGNLKPAHEWPSPWRKGLVAGIEVEQLFEGSGEDRKQVGTVSKVRLSDRIKRIHMIGQHIDVMAFKQKVEHDASADLKEFYKQVSGKSVRPTGG